MSLDAHENHLKHKSRYNLQNIVVVVANACKLIADGIFTEEEIMVIISEKEQAAKYRDILQKIGLFKLKASNVDSMQGREGNCIIFDIVLAQTGQSLPCG